MSVGVWLFIPFVSMRPCDGLETFSPNVKSKLSVQMTVV